MLDQVVPQETVFSSAIYDPLTQQGRYLDALNYAQSCWGPVSTWREPAKLEVAIVVLSHLGRDRDSDAVMLRGFRRYPDNAEFALKYAFYLLNRFGPIKAEDFYQQQAALLAKAPDQADLQVFFICLQSARKNFVEAKALLEQGLSQYPESSWLPRIELMLLRDQQLYDEEFVLAQAMLSRDPRVSVILDNSRALVRKQQSQQAMELLASHAPTMQSCRLWAELANIAARLMAWPICANAIAQYQQLQSNPDRDDADFIAACLGKIALERGDIEQALQEFAKTRHPYYRKVYQNLLVWQNQAEQSQGPMVRVLNVQHERQGHLTCAPATMAALCRYVGTSHSQQSIAEKICYDGTPETLERQWLRQNGFSYIELDLTPELTIALIDADLPFALVTTHGFSSHLQAVIGYHRGLGIAYIMDPSRDYTTELQLESGLLAEAAHGPRAMVFVPNEQAHRLQPFVSDVTKLYELYGAFAQARENNLITAAAAELAKMQQLLPEHRLTLIANRSLAIEQNDEPAILRATDALLARYPDPVVWLNSRFQSLKNLGEGEAALDYLFQAVQQQPHTDLKIRLFRQIYSMPRYRSQTLALLKQLRISGSYSAEVYDLLADYYWQEKQYALACRYYFYACCLDDTQQGYVESYYKAALYLNETADVLTRLQARFDKYGTRSASPAMSLYRVYNWQSKAQLGLDVLRKALELRPDDQELLVFSLQELLYHAQLTEFDQLFASASARLSPSQQNYWLAKKADWQGDFATATEHFRQCYLLTPWQSSVADAYFAALRRASADEVIEAELTKLAEIDSNHPGLLNYQADWHPNPEVVAIAIAKLAELFPHYSWYQRRAIRQLMQRGQLAEAETKSADLLSLLPHQVDNQLLHARILFKRQQLAAAKAVVEQILIHDINQSEAIDLLMDLSTSVSEKRQSLQWLVVQLGQQANYGDTMLDFAELAMRYLDLTEQQPLVEIFQRSQHIWASQLALSWLYQQQDDEAAYQQLLQAVSDFPLLPRLHLELADLAVKLGNKTQAVQSYQQALKLNPTYSRASRQYAVFLENEEQLTEEIAVIQQALQYDPKDGILHGFMADALMRADDFSQARYHLEKAVRFDNHYLWAWHRLARVCAEADEPDYAYQLALRLHQEAPHLVGPLRALAALAEAPELKVKYWQQSIALDPSHYQLQLPLLEYWFERGQYPQMFAHTQQQFGDAPQPFEIASLMAKAYEATGHHQQAAKMLSEALAGSNPELKYWEQLFDLQRKHKMKAELEHSARLLLARQPNDGLAICTAAEQLFFAGQKEEARSLFAKAWMIAPDHRYVALTYLDDLIDKKQYADADSVVQSLLVKHQDVWVLQRQLKVLLGLGEQAKAQQVWLKVVASKQESSYVYDNTFESFPDYAPMLAKQLAEHLPDASNFAGYCLGRYWQKQDRKALLHCIETAPVGEGWNGLYEFYLEEFVAAEALPPRKMLDPFQTRINDNAILAAKLANIYRVNGQLYQSAQLYQSIAPEQRPCYVSYHYGTVLADLNRWPAALHVWQQGANAEPDNCFHNLQLWRLAAEFIEHGEVSTDLQYINRQELTSTEILVLETLQLVLMLPTASGAEVLAHIKVIRQAGGKSSQISRVRAVGRAMFKALSRYYSAYSWSQSLLLRLFSWTMY